MIERYIPPQRMERAMNVYCSLLALGVGFDVSTGRPVALGAGVSPALQCLVDAYAYELLLLVPSHGVAPADGVNRPAPTINDDDRMRLVHRGSQNAKRREYAKGRTGWNGHQPRRSWPKLLI